MLAVDGSSLAGRVAIVTGAARGLGRAHALELAREGACVVVNDIGVALDGSPGSPTAADEVVAEITSNGGSAAANTDDVSDFESARRLVDFAVGQFGRLDAVVNNAGVVRDRMFVNASEDEWDTVFRVHAKGHFAVSRWAASYWRDRSKAGEQVDARIVNTTSGAGLLGSVGQAAYSAAKAAIASMTLVEAAELARYGVTANAIAPSARTRMTESVFAEMMAAPTDPTSFDQMAPENVSPLVAFLCSAASRAVTGRVFEVEGGRITVMRGWQRGPTVDKGARWEPTELRAVLGGLLASASPDHPVYGAS